MLLLSFVSVSNWSYLFLNMLTVVLFTTFSATLPFVHNSYIEKLVPLGGGVGRLQQLHVMSSCLQMLVRKFPSPTLLNPFSLNHVGCNSAFFKCREAELSQSVFICRTTHLRD